MELNGVILPDRGKFATTIGDILKGKGGLPLYLSLAGLAIGLYAAVAVFVIGHGETINTYSLVPWGLQITTYFYFIQLSVGCSFVNFFGMIYYPKEYKPFASRVILLGIMAAPAAFIALVTELGRVDRIYRMFVSPNFTSPMFWLSIWYGLYIAALVLTYVTIQTGKQSNKVLWGTFIIAIVTHTTSSSLLGVVSSRIYYYSALLPIYLLFIAFLTGSALAAIVVAFTVRQKKLDAEYYLRPFVKFIRIGLALAFLAGFWRIMIGLTSHVEGSEIFHLTARNNLVFGLGVSLIIPFVMLWVGRSPGWLAFTGLFVMLTQLKNRSDLVMGGFKIPVFRAYETPAIIHYMPSVYEFLILLASISMVCVLYLVSDKTGLFEIAGGKEEHPS
jgi:Ni/Fe-hydrogenase subunit HybB-like protein